MHIQHDHLDTAFFKKKKKQTSVSHSINSFDAGLSMDGILALDLWDVVIEVFHSSNNNTPPTQQNSAKQRQSQGSSRKSLALFRLRREGNQNVEQLSNLDLVAINATSCHCKAQLYIFEESEAVIIVIIKGRSLMMRYVSGNYIVALDWLFGRLNSDSKIQNSVN